jgi:two-component system, OmpR family, response regulator
VIFVAIGFKDGKKRTDMRILIVSDDSTAAGQLARGFRATGFSVDHATQKGQGEFWARATDYDLVIIEHTLLTNAAQICEQLRGRGKTMPIIIVARECEPHTTASLLDAGADDCVSKPCPIIELTARARALLRRPKTILPNKLELGDLCLDSVKCKVSRGQREVQLTKKEFGLLEYLLRHQDVVISRTALIEHVWDINADLFSNSLETHILNLRKKIEAKGQPKLIHTISGRGYKIALRP